MGLIHRQNSCSSSANFLPETMVERYNSLDICRVESITDLRIALYELKEDVERLEEELDAEREASATSASEAMSVILRLQGEKAILAMEASQYKRMAEERMSHVELSFELLEELNYQKEVEIENLERQLHAYRCKLMSLGFDDRSIEDCMSFWDRSQTPSPEPIVIVPVEKEVIEQSLDSRRDKEKNLVFYCKQIKKLDEQLKELTGFRDSIQHQYKTLKIEPVCVSETKNGEKSLCKTDLLVKKMFKKSSKQKRDRSIKSDQARGSCSADDTEYKAELQQLKERVKRLEEERSNKEPAQASETKHETMNLQRKSEEELCSVQSAMFSYDSTTVSVQEVC